MRGAQKPTHHAAMTADVITSLGKCSSASTRQMLGMDANANKHLRQFGSRPASTKATANAVNAWLDGNELKGAPANGAAKP